MCVYTCIHKKWSIFLVLRIALYLKKKWSFKRTKIIAQNIFSGWIFQLCLELFSSAFPYINSVCHHSPSLKEQPYINENKLTFPEASAQFFSVDHSYDPPDAQSSGNALSSNPAPFTKAKPCELPGTGTRSCRIFHWLNQNAVQMSLKRDLWRTHITFNLKWVDYQHQIFSADRLPTPGLNPSKEACMNSLSSWSVLPLINR